jgi:Coenzyme F420-dependent N5,N10-methylene tetrahydromethanopterin reductase and related flavin-dependent oxidoreductases
MRYGFVSPNADTRTLIERAQVAEEAGWDAFFIPDCIAIETPEYPSSDSYDPWVQLGALAVTTSRIKLGLMVTAVPRRRPWKLAREAMTVDEISHGRMIFAVGLGAAKDDVGFYKVGEPLDLRTRAELLDESLTIIDGLWRGERVNFAGKHYRVDGMKLLPTTVQQPRIPIWVVGVLGRPKSMRRALAWDGIVPQKMVDGAPQPLDADDVRALREAVIAARGSAEGYAIVAEGETPGDDLDVAVAQVAPLGEAGLTWWLESRWGESDPKALLQRIQQGPPRSRSH